MTTLTQRIMIVSILMFFSAVAHTGEVVDRIVAVVGNEIITLSDVRNFSHERDLETKRMGLETKDPIESLIREKLLKLEIQRLGLEPSDQDSQQAIDDVLRRNQITLAQLKSELAAKGMDFDAYKKDLADQIRRMKFLSQVIFPRIHLTEDEVARKAAGSTEEARIKARMDLLQERSPVELAKYLDEARAKTYVVVKP